MSDATRTPDLSGRTVTHYRILERIGAGGMGVVYRARDTRLERDVAIKVLPQAALADEGARRRFRREALAISRLTHPFIAAVHDFDSDQGMDFLVMEYVPGRTLAQLVREGAVPESEVLRLGIQIGEALEAAHERGIVHRDLKPGNIVITPQGHAKVLDFGLARRLAGTAGAATMTTLTETQSLEGTLPYMAPEQLLGREADPRSDVYSLGVTLYELVSGRRPFAADSTIALANVILNTPPKPPGRIQPRLSSRLEEIILRCLEKRPEARYPSAKDLLHDLRGAAGVRTAEGARRSGWTIGPVPPRLRVAGFLLVASLAIVASYYAAKRVGIDFSGGRPQMAVLAVLPFEAASADSFDQVLAAGVSGELNRELERITSLRVVSAASVQRLPAAERIPAGLRSRYGADAVLSGTLRRDKRRLWVEARVTRVADGHLLARTTEDRPPVEAARISRALALSLLRATRVRLTEDDRARLSRFVQTNPEAYNEYLRGQYYLGAKIEEQGHRWALEHFNAAIRLDPNYAPAWAGLATAYWSLSNAFMASEVAMPKARAAAEKALELDPDLPEAHTALATIYSQYAWEWTSAESEIRLAIRLNPGDPTAHAEYGQILIETGRPREAAAAYGRALALDPLSEANSGWRAMAYYYAGEYMEAERQLRSLIATEPDYATYHYSLGLCLEQLGRLDEAVSEFRTALAAMDHPALRALLAHALAAQGRRREALALLKEASVDRDNAPAPCYYIAAAYAGLGEADRALAWLERAFQRRDEELAFVKVDPNLAPLRTDPRFRELLRKMRLA